ncbi:MAG: class I SAM-dependent methyltransferase [Acidimicrobiia bacterium]|nr:class I SAM-dependent methyltransferase [Acidimicrobiia bacterium]
MTTDGGNEWDDHAEGWDDDEAVRSYAAAAFTSLLPVLHEYRIPLEGSRVLDFGCGTGLLTERLVAEGATVFAVDTSPAMLAVLENKISATGGSDVVTATAVPSSGEFDLVVCSSVCAFLDDYPGTSRELVDLLRPGGVFVQWDWEQNDAEAGSFGLSRVEIVDALGAAGLHHTVVETAFEILVEGSPMKPLIGHGVRPDVASDE